MGCNVTDDLYLSPQFSTLWSGKDPFDAVEKLDGKVYREMDGRKTLRFELDGKGYFLKIHRGVGWKEIFKNIVQLRLPVLGAKNEWLAIDKLKSIQVDTMTYVAYGKRGSNPATQLSFIITEELAGCISLEDFCLEHQSDPNYERVVSECMEKVVSAVSTLHGHGVNHRDLYICHFLFDADKYDASNPVYIIDLHRSQIRKQVPPRWRLKDVAGLWYSMREVFMKPREFEMFRERYGDETRFTSTFWRNVEIKAEKLLAQEKGL